MRIEDKKPDYFYRLPLEVRIHVPRYPGWEKDQQEREEAKRLGISVFEYRNGRPPNQDDERRLRRRSLSTEWARRGY